jgi:hypothetical protein
MIFFIRRISTPDAEEAGRTEPESCELLEVGTPISMLGLSTSFPCDGEAEGEG